jgi:hypothetical protein
MSKPTKQVIEEICEDCCHTHCQYCTAKQLLFWMIGQDPRNIIQIKCIEKYKYERSEQLNHDIGWEDAAMEWTRLYAAIFADVYNPDLSYSVIYKKVVGKLKQS